MSEFDEARRDANLVRMRALKLYTDSLGTKRQYASHEDARADAIAEIENEKRSRAEGEA